MNPAEYKEFYNRVGRINGWDFSKMKYTSEGVEWDFYDKVRKASNKSDLLLDIGTGGGEAVLSIADSALLLVGIDQSSGMIKTALENAAKSRIPNVRFLRMNAEKLEFPENFFNVVSCRHSEFNAEEISKVLVEGGLFLTQQVGENDKANLKATFGRGQALGIKSGTLKNKYVTELYEAGFTDVQSFEYNATEYYETAEDFVFLLKHTPIIPDFGRKKSDLSTLQQFIRDNKTTQGIRTNSERFMIIARL
ncbi:class I SAM-dependent methyltransferase [Paenibacillus sp. J22TS3]|uniref:class I SAM-dependent methyltransferase n=1 Tax=Paenibacillus sp. J22TS3 TaxID=2807192 RepID=UPI001AFE03D3|nr:class I SAM-dependent methyltransferase [Paenibacillus sp. J22TS3]GIP22026.1 methyltransferase [Paenibacillus sp. J22TS3]